MTNFNYQFFPSDKKKFQETLVIVPFFKAPKQALKRHINFFNSLGYDIATFTLINSFQEVQFLPFSSNAKFGLKHVWADQVEYVLNLSNGPKIVYAFSNPSAGAVEAIARRGANDIKALICDSGPSASILPTAWNYYTEQEPISFLPIKAALSIITTCAINPFHNSDINKDLKKFPKQFPILSIRGWDDKLIPVKLIDQVFEPHTHLNWKKLTFPEGGHLDGLKKFPQQYKPAVEDFLTQHSTPLN